MQPNSDLVVSVIVPCYNLAEYLQEALMSVLAQTFPNWECIIVNDGSTDNTEEVALAWCNKDKRFRYLRKDNGGISDARNAGIRMSIGKYILPLDADDKIGTKYLELAIKELENDPSLKLVYCDAEYFGEKSGKKKLKPYSFSSLLEFNMIFCSAIYRRSDFNNTKGYSIEMREGYEDWDYWLDLLTPDDRVFKLTEAQFYYRIRHDSRNRSIETDAIKCLKNRIFTNHIDKYTQQGICAIDLMTSNRQNQNVINSIHYKFGYFLIHPFAALVKKLKH